MTAEELGVFDRHGLSVELMEPAPGPENIVRVAEDGADLCLTSVAHYLRAREAHPALPARFVAMVTQQTPMAAFVVDGRPTAAGRVPARARDLAGARVAGTLESRLTRELAAHLEARGAAPGTLVDIPYAEWMPALAAGEVDAAPDFIDLLPRMRHRVPRTSVVGLRFCDDGAEHYGSGLVASDRLLAERPDAVRRVVAALREAWECTRDDPRRGLDAFARRYPEVPSDVVLECWRETERLIFAGPAGELDPDRLAATLCHVAAAQGLPLPEAASTFALVDLPVPS